MVTIGRGLHPSAHEFFEGLRTYDTKRSAAVLAEDADFESPWSGRLQGKAAIEAFLKTWLSDPKTRPSFTISDISGEGPLMHFKLSVSGRFGKAPEVVHMHVLRIRDLVHQVRIVPIAAHGHGH